MAKLNVIMVSFVILVVASTCIPSLAEENEPKKLWNQCVVKISLKCALNIISQVFGSGVVSIPCCQELVKEGKECHDTLVKYIAERPSLIGNESKYLQKRDEVWAHSNYILKYDLKNEPNTKVVASQNSTTIKHFKKQSLSIMKLQNEKDKIIDKGATSRNKKKILNLKLFLTSE
ncbi:hypothetical protein YC2023_084713 [Brassica napus]